MPRQADRLRCAAALPFAARLELRLAAEPPGRKGLRTRERLRVGAAIALEQKGFHDVRVADIAAAADTSPAAFYCYFQDKKDVALQVLQPFTALIFHADALGAAADPHAELTRAFRHVFTVARANPGLLRAADELRDEAPSWSLRMDLRAQAWHRRLAQHVLRRHPGKGRSASTADGVADVLTALTDGLARRISRRPESGPDIEELVAIWLHSLYPPPDAAAVALASAA